MDEVDKIVMCRAGGISTADLADWLSRDCYDSGMTPAEGAEEAMANDDLAVIFLD